MGIFENCQRQAEFLGGGFEAEFHPPVARFHDDQFFDARFRGVANQQIGECPTFVVCGIRAEFPVMDLQLFRAELIAKVPHGREEVGDAELVTPDMLDLLWSFGHPDHIGFGPVWGEQGRGVIELITQDDQQTT
jgi:hypothetical protein